MEKIFSTSSFDAYWCHRCDQNTFIYHGGDERSSQEVLCSRCDAWLSSALRRNRRGPGHTRFPFNFHGSNREAAHIRIHSGEEQNTENSRNIGGLTDSLGSSVASFELRRNRGIGPRIAVEEVLRDVTLGKEEERECPICLQRIHGIVKMTPCGHVYHAHCIGRWLRNKNTCPDCRHQLPMSAAHQRLHQYILDTTAPSTRINQVMPQLPPERILETQVSGSNGTNLRRIWSPVRNVLHYCSRCINPSTF